MQLALWTACLVDGCTYAVRADVGCYWSALPFFSISWKRRDLVAHVLVAAASVWATVPRVLLVLAAAVAGVRSSRVFASLLLHWLQLYLRDHKTCNAYMPYLAVVACLACFLPRRFCKQRQWKRQWQCMAFLGISATFMAVYTYPPATLCATVVSGMCLVVQQEYKAEEVRETTDIDTKTTTRSNGSDRVPVDARMQLGL